MNLFKKKKYFSLCSVPCLHSKALTLSEVKNPISIINTRGLNNLHVKIQKTSKINRCQQQELIVGRGKDNIWLHIFRVLRGKVLWENSCDFYWIGGHVNSQIKCYVNGQNQVFVIFKKHLHTAHQHPRHHQVGCLWKKITKLLANISKFYF